jgi:hypothetical protein
MGIVVPRARTKRKSDVFPGKSVCAIVEKKNADNPNPDTTRPVTVAR